MWPQTELRESRVLGRVFLISRSPDSRPLIYALHHHPCPQRRPVIARGLRAIVTGADPGALEIIMACKGCTDRKSEVARDFGPPVCVIEVDRASKIAALNAAEELATGFPRFYVDADVVLDIESIRAMAAVPERGDAHFAKPSVQMNLSKATWAVRASC